MFSDLCCLVLLWRCWIHTDSMLAVMTGCILAGGIIGLDYIFVSPLLVKLMEI
jgi:hypothetical protein